ncbi:hypothetical protein OH492_25520 [Vibrio chagasii]|nr:hypothetical protein [Vibrio chagasii]
MSEGKGSSKTKLPTVPKQITAEIAKFNQSGSKTLSLFASELPSISKGSLTHDRNLQVGSISDFQLADGGVRESRSLFN